jgi:hypothetical protein
VRLHGWTPPGGTTELALRCGPDGAGPCLLVLPALFDEANKTRHFTVEVMRALARRGIASVLPDLPGCNESLAPFPDQTLTGWQSAATEAARQLAASHVLTIRAGALFAPDLPGWIYAPLAGPSALRALLRARVLSSREGGVTETIDGLLDHGRTVGLDLAGYSFSAEMVSELADAALPVSTRLNEIRQADVGGAGLWLRAEPDHDPAQADALARIVAEGLAG